MKFVDVHKQYWLSILEAERGTDSGTEHQPPASSSTICVTVANVGLDSQKEVRDGF